MPLNSDIKELNRKSIKKDRVSSFHMRQAASMLVAFTVLVIFFFIMLVKQYDLAENHQKEILLKHFRERIAHLDNLLAGVTENVDMMRIAAEADLLQSSSVKFLNQPVEFSYLTDVADENRYHLDLFEPPVSREMIGNLTGQGFIENRSLDFYREIHMALGLNPLFQGTAFTKKDAAWIYYTSKNSFINIYPWVSSDDFKFSKELYTHEFFTFGLPGNNPERRMFWTKVYVDEYGKGLMTTCAAPVYDQDRFLGTVAIDLTVDFLNSIVRTFNPERGTMFMINDRDQLLAHPTLITSVDKSTKTLHETLPETLRTYMDSIKHGLDNEITHLGAFNILRSGLKQAPWQVIYLEEAPSFSVALKEFIGIGPIAALAMILIMIIVVFGVTRSQFILPSEKFVNYIMARSQRTETQIDKRIPDVWRPWFSAVEKVFRENEELTKALQEQNETLEQRVKERTFELEKEIEERKKVQVTLRESEDRFRDISYSTADWIWELDRNGKFLFATDPVKDILGYDSQDLIGKSPFDLMSEDEARRVKKILIKIFAEKKPVIDLENYNISKEGKKIYLQTNGIPILDDKGNLIGYRGINRNITDRKLAEEEQKKLEVQLQRAEKMRSLGTLAGGVAHDLNNILSGIVGYPDLLLMQIPEESPLRKPIETIKDTGLKAATIVQDLLTLARRGISTTEILNLNEVILEYLDSPEYKKLKSFHSEVQVKTDLDKDLLNIMGSPIHLSKTIMNLVSNAAEAMPMGGELVISTKNIYVDRTERGYDDVKEGDYIALTVSDMGVGISSEDREKIFEPFYTKKVMGRSGTGLGMAVVWGTVKDHNGYIDIQSSVGKGTTFTVYFPVSRKDIIKEGYKLSIDKYRGQGESILVVDDIKEQRDIAAMILSQLGYRVATVSSGEKAIEYVTKSPADLLVLDMIMEPGIDGLETYRRILEISPKQKAIIASGYSETARVKEAQRLGSGKYIPKPYTIEKIGIAVKEELGK